MHLFARHLSALAGCEIRLPKMFSRNLYGSSERQQSVRSVCNPTGTPLDPTYNPYMSRRLPRYPMLRNFHTGR